ncbi:hypothetical protein YS40_137 [Thermus phage phiYS40]|uniref:hypothetical protein n=1 Tax=Thermus phage phiYS40 TaxID=407392 RepID=UPI0000E689FF|nr:hypothetical protein YS40_137 [Thermus phage phiYS40]ABJ91531.1 hypothetical protein YS40_137 [Thermus phage phiYS40]BAK53655.1 hypothetical protein YSP_137 [Thermus phage phiYS40]
MIVKGVVEDDVLIVKSYNYSYIEEEEKKEKIRKLDEFLENNVLNEDLDTIILERRFKDKRKNKILTKKEGYKTNIDAFITLSEYAKNKLLKSNIKLLTVEASNIEAFKITRRKGNFSSPGWKQILTGINKPNDKEIEKEINSLVNKGKIIYEVNIEDLLAQKVKFYIDFIDAVGMLYAYIKKPEIYALEEQNDNKEPEADLYEEITKELSKKLLGPIVS